MRSSSWARARSKKAVLTSSLAQTRSFGLAAERMLFRISNCLRGAVHGGLRSGLPYLSLSLSCISSSGEP